MSIISLQVVRTLGSITPGGVPSGFQNGEYSQKSRINSFGCGFSGRSSDVLIGRGYLQDVWSARLWRRVRSVPLGGSLSARAASPDVGGSAVAVAEHSKKIAISSAKAVGLALLRAITALQRDPLVCQCLPALALMAFSLWGLGPTTRFLRKIVKKKDDVKWIASRTRYVMVSYIRPSLLWIGVYVICRAFDPVVLSSEASHAIKTRCINFVRSLSTVLAFAVCTASLTQQIHRAVTESQAKEDTRNLGLHFVGNAVYTAVWIAAVCLFMELLGFSTQKWITAGGFGTVLLTLAGREIFTNFLSSVMIHATRPFVENEWIQTKIEGQEVSGTVEHVGWWSPTIVRGDDREAVHIPNHKFTVTVVRNLSQKTHWRIKTHFGISHLDVGKVPEIVSDMRKVISKHPQVEQQRLHRRAFFDNIDPENQALLILVSCFVKTSHFEEYLRVKEIILLECLRVISHHNARLATPIRTVQRILNEDEARASPFRDAPVHRSRPLFMLEAAAGATAVTVSTAVPDSEEIDLRKLEASILSADTGKENAGKGVSKETSTKEAGKEHAGKSSTVKAAENVEDSNTKQKEKAQETADSSPKPQLEGLDSMGLNSNDITLLKAAFEKPPANIPEGPRDSVPHVDIAQGEKAGSKTATKQQRVPKAEGSSLKATIEPHSSSGSKTVTKQQKVSKADSSGLNVHAVIAEEASSSNATVEHVRDLVPLPVDDPWREPAEVAAPPTLPAAPQKSDVGQSTSRNVEEKVQASQVQVPNISPAQVSRVQSVQDNLVLGVALDGPKRTLPLDDGIPPPAKQKDDVVPPPTGKSRELVTSRNGSGSTQPKDSRDPSSNSQSNSSGSTFVENPDKER